MDSRDRSYSFFGMQSGIEVEVKVATFARNESEAEKAERAFDLAEMVYQSNQMEEIEQEIKAADIKKTREVQVVASEPDATVYLQPVHVKPTCVIGFNKGT